MRPRFILFVSWVEMSLGHYNYAPCAIAQVFCMKIFGAHAFRTALITTAGGHWLVSPGSRKSLLLGWQHNAKIRFNDMVHRKTIHWARLIFFHTCIRNVINRQTIIKGVI